MKLHTWAWGHPRQNLKYDHGDMLLSSLLSPSAVRPPSSVDCVIVFRPDLANEEHAEDQILFCQPRSISPRERVSTVSFVNGVAAFASTFSGEPCEVVHTQLKRYFLKALDPATWVVAVVRRDGAGDAMAHIPGRLDALVAAARCLLRPALQNGTGDGTVAAVESLRTAVDHVMSPLANALDAGPPESVSRAMGLPSAAAIPREGHLAVLMALAQLDAEGPSVHGSAAFWGSHLVCATAMPADVRALCTVLIAAGNWGLDDADETPLASTMRRLADRARAPDAGPAAAGPGLPWYGEMGPAQLFIAVDGEALAAGWTAESLGEDCAEMAAALEAVARAVRTTCASAVDVADAPTVALVDEAVGVVTMRAGDSRRRPGREAVGALAELHAVDITSDALTAAARAPVASARSDSALRTVAVLPAQGQAWLVAERRGERRVAETVPGPSTMAGTGRARRLADVDAAVTAAGGDAI